MALPLPDDLADALERLQGDISVGRVVPPENLHVTLAFLGDLEPGMAEEVRAALCEVEAPPVILDMRGVDVFGGDDPRMVFAGVEPDPALKALRDKVYAAARGVGLELSRKRFRPHVTLSRFSRRMPQFELDRLGSFLEAHGAFRLEPVEVSQFGLYRSILSQEGPRYEELALYDLGPLAARGGQT
ncbi:RNA 2',3'-cyclic phosphodiesterase [Roseovarius sp. MMSF_3281]|uniref:RNA 2',3'-cyclic phosphodiesterase n=1 Tax=Roseovarius sp. MMSF_3281 TaxID=3046694 RepID=UPI00273D4DEF|nr:RNA 2',3'-cyclic phosphodiesterase [Roseovarius sp. MMSF_3281]